MEEQKVSFGNEVESIDALAVEPDRLTAQPWQKQPGESPTSFKRFTEFYLLQQPPRSLAEAYRRFRIRSGLDPAQAKRIKYTPAAWKNWAYARDTYGRPIPQGAAGAGQANDAGSALSQGERGDHERRRQDVYHAHHLRTGRLERAGHCHGAQGGFRADAPRGRSSPAQPSAERQLAGAGPP